MGDKRGSQGRPYLKVPMITEGTCHDFDLSPYIQKKMIKLKIFESFIQKIFPTTGIEH